MHLSCPFHDYQLKLCALTAPQLILLISTHPFILSIYHIMDCWSKIRFRMHIIIIQMHPLKKSQKTDSKGGWGGSTLTVSLTIKRPFFVDDSPNFPTILTLLPTQPPQTLTLKTPFPNDAICRPGQQKSGYFSKPPLVGSVM